MAPETEFSNTNFLFEVGIVCQLNYFFLSQKTTQDFESLMSGPHAWMLYRFGRYIVYVLVWLDRGRPCAIMRVPFPIQAGCSDTKVKREI